MTNQRYDDHEREGVSGWTAESDGNPEQWQEKTEPGLRGPNLGQTVYDADGRYEGDSREDLLRMAQQAKMGTES